MRLSRLGFRVAFLGGEARFRESVPPALGCSQAGSRLGAQSASCIVSPLTLLLSVQACDPGHCQVQRFLRRKIGSVATLGGAVRESFLSPQNYVHMIRKEKECE